VARGTPGLIRTHCVSVRLTDEEFERWKAARDSTERKELGAWVRAVVEEALQGHPGVPGDVPKVPEVNEAAFEQLAQAAADLRNVARALLQAGRDEAAVERVLTQVGEAAMAVRGLERQ